MRCGAAAVAFVTTAAIASWASAQTDVRATSRAATALDRFDPSPAGDPLLGVPEPHVRGHLRPAAGALLTLSRSPLVLVRGADDDEVADVVSHQLYLHTLLSLHLWRRVALEVDIPVVLDQGGELPPGPGLTSPSGAATGDVRAGVRVELLRRRGYWPAAALAMTAWFPSGSDGAYASTGSVRFAPSLIVGLSDPDFVYSARVGRRFVPGDQSLVGDTVFFGAGGGPKFGALTLTAEILGASDVARRIQATTTHLEAHLGARLDVGPVRFQLAGGPGLTTAPGTPDWRVGFFVGYTPGAPTADRAEGDPRGRRQGSDPNPRDEGLPSRSDGRPEGASTTSDRDGDGVVDALDVCPARVGPPGGKRPGCPPDRDADGVGDARDACPDRAGVPSDDPERDGCPGDRDGDGIDDARDACPEERGDRTDDPKTTGCPGSVRVVGEQIVILQKVAFATGRAELTGDSATLLAEVAQVLDDHPEIVRVAIEGHTDDVGAERENISLSQRRALTVMRWLIERGVDERRLEARGYGPRQPVADNGTAEGRSANRRVDFLITRRDPRGRAAWVDGNASAPEEGR
ncbi:MAG: OmpA family protein [Myxococcota bacterium]